MASTTPAITNTAPRPRRSSRVRSSMSGTTHPVCRSRVATLVVDTVPEPKSRRVPHTCRANHTWSDNSRSGYGHQPNRRRPRDARIRARVDPIANTDSCTNAQFRTSTPRTVDIGTILAVVTDSTVQAADDAPTCIHLNIVSGFKDIEASLLVEESSPVVDAPSLRSASHASRRCQPCAGIVCRAPLCSYRRLAGALCSRFRCGCVGSRELHLRGSNLQKRTSP